jgi:hypothetical protein
MKELALADVHRILYELRTEKTDIVEGFVNQHSEREIERLSWRMNAVSDRILELYQIYPELHQISEQVLEILEAFRFCYPMFLKRHRTILAQIERSAKQNCANANSL